jgi:hypothetical protein
MLLLQVLAKVLKLQKQLMGSIHISRSYKKWQLLRGVQWIHIRDNYKTQEKENNLKYLMEVTIKKYNPLDEI